MPTITVDDKGTELYYDDTGPPDVASQYTTFLLIHGSLFHGKIFERLLPYSFEYNARLVLLNSRDYPGSTPYSQQELQDVLSGDILVQQEFVRSMGREIAQFLVQYTRSNQIHPLQRTENGQMEGGVVLVGWSMGSSVPISLLAWGDSLLPDTKEVLGRYLRTVVVYDASVTSVGVPPAEGVYHPMRDVTLSPKERGDLFLSWVSSYFTAFSSLEEATPALLGDRMRIADEVRLPTVKGMSSKELASCTHPDALASNLAMRQVACDVYATNLRRALVDTGGIWKDVGVLVLWCDMTPVDSVWGSKGIMDLVRSERSEHCTRRRVEFVKLEGANHFAHWDEPQKFMNVLVRAS